MSPSQTNQETSEAGMIYLRNIGYRVLYSIEYMEKQEEKPVTDWRFTGKILNLDGPVLFAESK